MNIKTATTKPKRAQHSVAYVTLIEDSPTYIEKEGRDTRLVIGIPKAKHITLRHLQTIVRSIVRTAKKHKIEHIAFDADIFDFPSIQKEDVANVWSLITENLLLADYEFDTYRKEKVARVQNVHIYGALKKDAQKGITRGKTVGMYTNIARDIANTPGGDMTPALLAQEARKAAKNTSVRVRVLTKKQIEDLGMGALLGVARGSRIGPRFIIMEHWGAGKPRAQKQSKKSNAHDPVVFVGKGITFDTGGLSLKPSDGMLDMHLDMSGGAAVIGAVACAGKLNIKKNIIGLIPAAENAVSDESMRPGDVLKTISGKTIDVLNTDAEGRLVLADGLGYAKRYNPRLVVDVATLTGAALIALGTHASAVMSPEKRVYDTLATLGEKSGEYLWPFPLWEEYRQYTKGRFADVANIPASGNTRYAGVINAGMFLYNFVEGYSWAHIDMAPRMTANQSDCLAKGATGEPTRLLVRVAERYS